MKAQVLHSQASVVVRRTHPRLEAPSDFVVRLSRSAICGADLCVEPRAIRRSQRRARDGHPQLEPVARSLGVIALTRLATSSPLERPRVPLRSLLHAAPKAIGPRPSEAMRLERWLDELRAHRYVDDLVEWLIRARPRADEMRGERLSVARVVGEESFGDVRPIRV
jgi:hypothetical protein